MLLSLTRKDWLGNVRGDVLADTVVALALTPEAIAFSIIAGVDLQVGLCSAFCIPLIIAICGGHPGMISSSTDAMALLMVTLVRDHDLQYLLATTVLTGVIQLVAGYLKLGSLIRCISRSVVIGFVNALAILIFMMQLPELTDVTRHVYAVAATGLGIIYLFPYLNKTIPSPLTYIVMLTRTSMWLHLDIRTVGDMDKLSNSLPIFLSPDMPLNFDTLSIIPPYSAGLAVVGLLGSVMTTTIMDDMTDTSNDKNRGYKAQGVIDIGAAFIGDMTGYAMIGQSVISVKSGGHGRLFALSTGIVLPYMVVSLRDWVSQIPMVALVAMMIMVSIDTFSWHSITSLRSHPLSTSVVMLATVAMVVTTHSLAYGVLTGVLIASLNFTSKVSRSMAVLSEPKASTQTYTITGQVFFASIDRFMSHFDFCGAVERVIIDVSHAYSWDITSVSALDRVVIRSRRGSTDIEIRGMNQATRTIISRFRVYDEPKEMGELMDGH